MSSPLADPLFPAHLAEMIRRADHALQDSAFEALVFAAGTAPMQFADDQPYPFKASAHFRAWAPLTEAPGSCVMHRPGHRPTLFFCQPEDFWHQVPARPQQPWVDCFDVVCIKTPADIAGFLPAHSAWIGPDSDAPVSHRAVCNPASVVARLDYARAIKTDYEIHCLEVASQIACAGHRAAQQTWAEGGSEYDIHLAYLKATEHEDAQLPYANIIALNEAASVLHYTYRRRQPLEVRRSLLIDAGATYSGYGSDITRTYSAMTGVFADLTSAVERLELTLCDLVTPGRSYIDIQLAAHRGIATILCDSGLVRVSAEDALARGITAVFFPHGIGHLLGLQVHDVGGRMANEEGVLTPRPPGHPYLRLTRRLEAGYVVTIEPGLYFIDLLLKAARLDERRDAINWETVDALAPFGGIRIEDNVVAGSQGAKNLTRLAFA